MHSLKMPYILALSQMHPLFTCHFKRRMHIHDRRSTVYHIHSILCKYFDKLCKVCKAFPVTISGSLFKFTRNLKVSCLFSQLSLIFGHPSPSTSMYFALFPYFFPYEEFIRKKVFFRLNRSLLLYPKVLLNFSWLPL